MKRVVYCKYHFLDCLKVITKFRMTQEPKLPYLPKVKAVFEFENEKIVLVLEKMQDTLLVDYLNKNLSIDDSLLLAKQVAIALQALQKFKIAIGDINMENIAVTSNGHVKILKVEFDKLLQSLETKEKRSDYYTRKETVYSFGKLIQQDRWQISHTVSDLIGKCTAALRDDRCNLEYVIEELSDKMPDIYATDTYPPYLVSNCMDMIIKIKSNKFGTSVDDFISNFDLQVLADGEIFLKATLNNIPGVEIPSPIYWLDNYYALIYVTWVSINNSFEELDWKSIKSLVMSSKYLKEDFAITYSPIEKITFVPALIEHYIDTLSRFKFPKQSK